MAEDEKVNIKDYLEEKFPETDPQEEDFINPMTAQSQIDRVKANFKRSHPGIDTKFKRLKAGKSFE